MLEAQNQVRRLYKVLQGYTSDINYYMVTNGIVTDIYLRVRVRIKVMLNVIGGQNASEYLNQGEKGKLILSKAASEGTTLLRYYLCYTLTKTLLLKTICEYTS